MPTNSLVNTAKSFVNSTNTRQNIQIGILILRTLFVKWRMNSYFILIFVRKMILRTQFFYCIIEFVLFTHFIRNDECIRMENVLRIHRILFDIRKNFNHKFFWVHESTIMTDCSVLTKLAAWNSSNRHWCLSTDNQKPTAL